MNIHEIKKRLLEKTIRHKIYDLQTENNKLKSRIDELEDKIHHLENENYSKDYILEELSNSIFDLRQFLISQNET